MLMSTSGHLLSKLPAFQLLRPSIFRFSRLPSITPSQPRRSIRMASLWTTDLGSGVINLGKVRYYHSYQPLKESNNFQGHPNPSLLPLPELSDAFLSASKRESAAVNMLQYGRMQGNAQLCKQLSEWIANESGREAPKLEHIMITNGSGPALATACQIFTKPGSTVFVDSPAYFLSFYTFEDAQLKIQEIPTDGHGLNVDEIERRLKAGERPSMVYTVPVANNPTGVSMTEDRKKRLVELAREYDFLIASDEVYVFLSFEDNFPTSLFDYDDPTNPKVLAFNSFSKLIGPGLRLGWMTAHKPYMERMLNCGSLQSGGGFNPLTSAVVSEMMASGIVYDHVKRVREYYRKTCKILVSQVETTLQSALREGETLSFEKPTGGFFMFIYLPERINAEKLLELAKKHGVSFFAGRHSSADKSQFQNAIRLCFAFVEDEGIREGVRRLAEAVRAYE